jgi:NAD(P)H-dependent flavin oxidoreductase YrpB (nitropropane dioxygenase family)
MSVLPTRYTELVGIEHPIIQEGMGPFKTVALAAAVSNAGGMGTISMPGMSQEPSEGAAIMRSHISACAELTDKPFAVNVPVGADDNGKVLPITEAYINAVIAAREADSKVGQQLKVLTTSAGFPGAFASRIKDAGLIHQHKVGSRCHHRLRIRDGRPYAPLSRAHLRVAAERHGGGVGARPPVGRCP